MNRPLLLIAPLVAALVAFVGCRTVSTNAYLPQATRIAPGIAEGIYRSEASDGKREYSAVWTNVTADGPVVQVVSLDETGSFRRGRDAVATSSCEFVLHSIASRQVIDLKRLDMSGEVAPGPMHVARLDRTGDSRLVVRELDPESVRFLSSINAVRASYDKDDRTSNVKIEESSEGLANFLATVVDQDDAWAKASTYFTFELHAPRTGLSEQYAAHSRQAEADAETLRGKVQGEWKLVSFSPDATAISEGNGILKELTFEASPDAFSSGRQALQLTLSIDEQDAFAIVGELKSSSSPARSGAFKGKLKPCPPGVWLGECSAYLEYAGGKLFYRDPSGFQMVFEKQR